MGEQMLTDLQAVLFDLDGTLLDRRRSFLRFVREQWDRFPHVIQAVDQEQYVQALVTRDRDGYAPRQEADAVIEELGELLTLLGLSATPA